MKIQLTLLLLIALTKHSGFAQNTTEEEFNWMSKGYQVMISSGLDMKSGYYFDLNKELSESRGSYEFNFKFFHRESDSTLAGILITAKSKISGKTYYYGLPIGEWVIEGGEKGIFAEYYEESPYMPRFLNSINELDHNMTRAFFASLWKLYAQTLVEEMPSTKRY